MKSKIKLYSMVVSFALMQELKDVLTISKFIIGTKVKCLESLQKFLSNFLIQEEN